MSKSAGRHSLESILRENISRMGKLRRQGLTEEEIAKSIGVAYSTFRKYKLQIPEMAEELQKSKEVLIEDLEDTLYRKALGLCTQVTTKKYIDKTPDGKTKQKIEETTVQIPPDTACLCFALSNLDPKRFKNNRSDSDFNFTDLENKLKTMKSFSEKAEEMDKKLKNQVKEESPL